jgi:LysW-gamma-L-lysine carboxypeptidase
MSRADAVDLLQRMVAIPSPSGEEQELSSFLVERSRAWGLRAHVDEAGNFIAETGGDGPTVMLVGHMDTAGDAMAAGVADGRIWGRGAVDAKGPLATALCAAAAAPHTGTHLVVAGAVEEETPASRGAVHLRDTWPEPAALLIGEPSGWDRVVLGYRGKVDIRYKVELPASHPASPNPKASEVAADFWQWAVEAPGETLSHDHFDQTGVTLENMAGDLTSATLELSYRTPPDVDVPRLLERLHEYPHGGQITVQNAVPAVRVRPTNPVVRALRTSIADLDGAPRSVLKTATSDMNTLGAGLRVPMASYGPGDSRLDHGDDEHIPISEYLSAISVLTRALSRLSGTLEPRPQPAGGGNAALGLDGAADRTEPRGP